MTDKQKQAMSILYRLAQEKCITEEEHIILSEVITEQQQPNVWRETTFPQTLGPYYDYNGIFGPVTCTTSPAIASWASTTIDYLSEYCEPKTVEVLRKE